MTDCKLDRMVPIGKVVNAALIDSYQTAGKSKELYYHWAARGLKKIDREHLKTNSKRVLIQVNQNTKTATLPLDFDGEIFVGYINGKGRKVPMVPDASLENISSISELPCEDACTKCGQSKSICNDMTVTESTEVVLINGNGYDKTTIKKLYPNGDYYLEVNTPYFNTVTNVVEYAPVKKFITSVALKDCGCLEDTEENIEKIRSCNSDVYSCYYAPCDAVCDGRVGGYRILEEVGLIQLDFGFTQKKLYMEYNGFMSKRNGQYYVPEVAFETLVEWTKFKSIQNKPSVTQYERNTQFQHYTRESENMQRILGRVTLSVIIAAHRSVPNFEIDFGYTQSYCTTENTYVTRLASSKVSEAYCSDVAVNSVSAGSGTHHLTPFQLAVIAGSVSGGGAPVEGEFTYTNAGLIGAVNLNIINVNKNDETVLAGDFTFDPALGKITRINPWVAGDVLIAPFAKLV